MHWTTWTSVKHQDGRRNSAIGYNQSKWHLVMSDENCFAACGREIMIPGNTRATLSTKEKIKYGVCKQCQRRYKREGESK